MRKLLDRMPDLFLAASPLELEARWQEFREQIEFREFDFYWFRSHGVWLPTTVADQKYFLNSVHDALLGIIVCGGLP